MGLEPGTRVGPYEVMAVLGSGGMGVVYRARDERAGREVALKTLAGSTSDPSRQQRFEQEARAASALTHPNVVAVFDAGRQGDTPFLVTELLEGETLRQRLDAGPLPLARALDVVSQVTKGLIAVHAAQVVHRDLKPDNLFLTRDGVVKILDFGVASVAPSQASAGTGTLPLTQEGAVLGTAGYMSPEQVRGRAADCRSDLFALGAILAECLSGKLAFPGESPVERGYAILNAPPVVPGDAPPAVSAIISRCLEKSPDARFQTARELLVALDIASAAGSPPASLALHPPPRAKPSTWLTVSAAALALVAAVGWLRPRPAPITQKVVVTPPPSVAQPSVTHPVSTRRVTFRNGNIFNARFNADGKGVVYSGTFEGSLPQVYAGTLEQPLLRTVSTTMTTLLDLSSKDDLALGDLSRSPEHPWGMVLSKASLAGGAARALLDGVQSADFGPDDELLVTRFDGQKWTIEYPAGHVRVADSHPLALARLSPDGTRVAFLRYPVAGDDRGTVEVLDLEGHRLAHSRPAWSVDGLAWGPTGKEVWFSAGYVSAEKELWALPVDGKSSERRVYSMPGSIHLLDIDPRGRMLASVGIDRSRIFGRVGSDEKGEKPLSWFDGSIPVDLSDDGQALLFLEGNGPSGTEVQTWLRSFEGDTPPVQLSLGYGRALSKDKKWALVSPTPPFTSLRLVPTGPGTAVDLPPGDFLTLSNARFFPDGQRVALTATAADGNPRIYVQGLVRQEGEDVVQPMPVSDESLVLTGPPSADGRQLLAVTRAREPVLVNVESGELTHLKAPAGSFPVQWTADGKAVLLAHRPEKTQLSFEVQRYELASGKTSTVGPAMGPQDTVGVTGVRGGFITPDTKHYVYAVSQRLDELYMMEGLVN